MAATDDVASEVAELATQIADVVGFSFADASDERLNSDGAWEYHFECDDRWGFVAAGPEGMVETTYPGWQTLVIEPDHWAVFHGGTLVGNVSLHGGRIKWYASPTRDEYPSDLPSAMREAFRAELDAVAPSLRLFVDPKGGSHAQAETDCTPLDRVLLTGHAFEGRHMPSESHDTIPPGHRPVDRRTGAGKTAWTGRLLCERWSSDGAPLAVIDPKAGG